MCHLTVSVVLFLVLAGGAAHASCGDGTLDLGEQCDPGLDVAGDCCTSACALTTAGTICRPIAGPCDIDEECDGADSACPVDRFQPDGMRCVDGDGDPCTHRETCEAGVCAGLPVAEGMLCDDGNPCTVGDACRDATCAGYVRPNGASCDDQRPCTEPDTCQAGLCAGPTVADGKACEDESFCTENETCQAGACAGTPKAEGAACEELPGTCGEGLCRTPGALSWARVRPGRSATHSGSIHMRGHFETYPPDDTVSAAAGITVRITDALNLDRTFTWSPVDCRTTVGILCVRRRGLKVRFQPRRSLSAGTYGLKLLVRGVDIEGPLKPPVTATITDGSGTARVLSIDRCTFATSDAISCRLGNGS